MASSLSELKLRDFQDIHALCEDALGCDTMEDLQQRALFQIQQIIGADSSVYFDVNRTCLGWQFINGMSKGVPEEAPITWCEHYQTEDPFVIRLLQSRNTRVVSSDNTLKHADYVRTELYCDFLRPQSIYHMLTVVLKYRSQPIGLVGLHRSANSSAFSRKEISKVDAIVPYLSAAVQKIKLSEMTSERKEIIKVLADDLHYKGVMILNRDLFPVFLDENARKLFNVSQDCRHENFKTVAGFLPAQIYQYCREIKERIKHSHDTKTKQYMDFTVKKDAMHISGYVYAYEAALRGLCFMICFNTGAKELISPDNFSKFSLTRREIDIVHLVSAGMTNPEIAGQLNISIRTVQAHLRSIYDKVQVHNRTSLVSRLILEN